MKLLAHIQAAAIRLANVMVMFLKAENPLDTMRGEEVLSVGLLTGLAA